jgi:signal transduction histidine kinase
LKYECGFAPDFAARCAEPLPSAIVIDMAQGVDYRKQVRTAERQSVSELVHDIRNPLASIQGVADAFLRRGQLTGQEREWMEAVRREVSKIDARLREMLDVSQCRVFYMEQCSLSELIKNVVMLASHHVNGRHVRIEFIDTEEPLLVYLDQGRIEDAVLNLVINAIESIDGNGCVTVRLSTDHDEALIEVSDTGCGIRPRDRPRIFEPRFTTKLEGTGLGLVAVRRTAAAHHGRITFKTRIGRGSKFVLALPLRPQQHRTENSR